MTPPSPIAICLLGKKPNTAASPNVPARRPRCSAPIASHASSTTAAPCRRADSSSGPIAAGRPNTCTGSNALTRRTPAAPNLGSQRRAAARPEASCSTTSAARTASMFSDSGSMSTKTGTARWYRMTFADATNEYGVVTTRSCAVTPAAIIVRWSPAVPLDTATACRAPRYAAHSRSNSSIIGPQLRARERRTSLTSATSDGPMSESAMRIGPGGVGYRVLM